VTGHRDHPGDELQLLLDGRLAPNRRASVEAHVAGCPQCRAELGLLSQVKSSVRHLADEPVPSGLRDRISAALAAEGPAPVSPARPGLSRRRIMVIGASLAAAAALLLVVLGRPRDPVAAATADFADYRAGRLRLEFPIADPALLERTFAEARIRFATRVFDFGMMGFRLAGGSLVRSRNGVSALFAYEGDDGRRVTCQMYEGRVEDLPAPAEEREHNGIRFLVYRVEGATLVFWQEGAIVCVLVADGDPEAAIQLAYAKAVKV
jgi:anti-sigma factor (TIGR02949 family)